MSNILINKFKINKMTAHEALKNIKLMLGLDQVETNPSTEVKFAEATLLDGTVVTCEGELEVGKALFVVTPDGNVPAPEGIHETTDGYLISVDAAGIITNIEEKVMEEETSKEFSDDMVNQIAGLIKPALDQINELKNEIKNLKGEFHSFKDEPAAEKITNNLDEYRGMTDEIFDAKLSKIYEIRNSKK